MPMTPVGGIQTRAGGTMARMPQRSVDDCEDILARLEALPKRVVQNIALLQEGMKSGYTPPKLMLREVPKQITGLIPADAMGSPLLEPFTEFPARFPEAEPKRLTDCDQDHYPIAGAPALP